MWIRERDNSSVIIHKTLKLRSWVQIPPGPLLTVLELRYYFELVLGSCRTIPIEVPLKKMIESNQ